MFRSLSAIFRKAFKKEKYINDSVKHSYAIIQLNYRILKSLKDIKSVVHSMYSNSNYLNIGTDFVT
jgi:hypothetical protein